MSITYKDLSRLPGLQIAFSLLVIGIVLLLAGCIAGVPLQTEKPSDHFDVKYVETHQRSTKQEVVKELGWPEVIFRSKDKTYYVYDATGDTRMIVGAVFIVPPFFVPFWTPKDEGDALHCLALIFDERGLLQDYVAATASEEAWGGLLLPPEPGAWPWWGEVTECGKVLWKEKELAQLDVVAHEEEIRSLETATPNDRLSLWAYSVFGNTTDGYNWLCRAADQGGMESRLQLGNVFYNESHRSRDNLIQAYVWYRLLAKDNNPLAQARISIVEKLLSDNELQEAQNRLRAWVPGQCKKDIVKLQQYKVKAQQDKPDIEREVLAQDRNTRADQGDLEAQFELYILNPNSEEGLRWLCTAANQGHVDAQISLGDLYSSRNRGPRYDPRWAYVWLSLAALEGGKKRVSYELFEVRRSMNPKQLDEAEKMLANWKPGQCERDLVPEVSGN